ncbi:UDP-N-acetylmuramoyl-L-alanyl-D-glutamate--2,6-diaminopimelate ligase [Cytophagales bacterium LB-30]|uniref:UDP-N-acetylmuramoyl-L-alanyl-D-glutamate--2,6-diaminopimelate ligase n=1 Tax=Shiella aurantiaca TaxID=3058365 RepID=A0ABT8F2C7_9BACT|nr:UDP-N-acetylmuramoyl-L-alanyl-D-glutamate--2,6-diaminopimelate ligase [Shiella aurantiaca]MDN4164429.1 UDP-N-acetylmuramoyl-L-alanyl-D-glutamate--2,6-diaminopimelate ligase [Shiella aurantiaca]
MAILKDIVYKVTLKSISGDMNKEIASVCFDSRQVKQGDLFVATRGTQVDGHQYIAQAVAQGAVAVVCETLPETMPDAVCFIETNDSAYALGIIASNFYGNPSAKLKLVAVTGTNGKTTTATILHKLFMALGYSSGLLSTVVNKINEEEIVATHTTPDALSLNALLAQMVKKGCTHCFMEASSHAIVQHRMAGIEVAGAIFTNISHDHLDYHGTFDAYIKAKKKLFDDLPSSAFALVNVDDKRGMVMLQNTKAAKHTFALKTLADFKGRIISNTIQGLQLEIAGKEVWCRLVGDFNAYNLVGIYGAAMLLGEQEEEVLMQLSTLTTAPGRFEIVRGPNGLTAIVDYAHTPDALENVLTTIQGFRMGNEQIITVVGCGGNRDSAKRPIMSGIAAKYSDRVILTSDNPRNEEPEQIIKEMQEGVSITQQRKVLSITDRREAIKTACALAQPKDIILIAGKGHETYQEIKGVKYDFDDKKVVTEFLNLMTQ